MALTAAILEDGIRTIFAERGQFLTSAEIARAVWKALDDLNIRLKYLKDTTTITGSGYITSWGTSPKRYEPPDDFLIPDEVNGVIQAGLRRLGMNEQKFYSYQSRAITDSQTLTGNDFFEQDVNGLIFHYTVDFIVKSELDASPARNGRLVWFEPNLENTDTVTLWYLVKHPNPATKIYLPDEYENLCIYDAAKFLALKYKNANRGAAEIVPMMDTAFKNELSVIEQHIKDKVPDERLRVMGPRELGMYSSHVRGSRYDYLDEY